MRSGYWGSLGAELLKAMSELAGFGFGFRTSDVRACLNLIYKIGHSPLQELSLKGLSKGLLQLLLHIVATVALMGNDPKYRVEVEGLKGQILADLSYRPGRLKV